MDRAETSFLNLANKKKDTDKQQTKYFLLCRWLPWAQTYGMHACVR